MRNFEQTIYPITPYCEYLATSYLIDKNKKYLTNDDIKTLKDLSANPSDSYLLHFITSLQYSLHNALLFSLGGSNDKDHPPFEIIDARFLSFTFYQQHANSCCY
jgi:hypothetical protein